jgi:DNA-binding transcriptional ArsR family regulator
MAFEPREVTDPKAMRALAHPIRLALIEALADHPALTATEAGELVGESPANTSFHLRQLAKYGFVEEAEGGTGRRQPWKLKHLGTRISDVHDDLETVRAAREVERVMLDRYFARAQRAFLESAALPPDWRDAQFVSQMRLYLSAGELTQLSEDLRNLVMERYADRRTERPPGTERVEILSLSYRTP